jgi:hypothetical protein
MVSLNKYDQDLGKNTANYVPLSPLSFIRRTAEVFPDRTAVIHGENRRTWSETYARCRRLASALARRGIELRFSGRLGRTDLYDLLIDRVGRRKRTLARAIRGKTLARSLRDRMERAIAGHP